MSDSTTHWVVRTAADLKSLLLEIARALRGLAFYSETDPRRGPLIDRAYRAIESELSRAGRIDLRVDAEGFHLVGLNQVVPSSEVIGGLASALWRHRLERIRLDTTLTRDALRGLLELLGHPRDRYETPEDFARTLSAREASGIRLNEIDIRSEALRRELSATPPHPAASPTSTIVGQDFSAAPDPAASLAEEQKQSLDADPLAAVSPDDRGERLRARLIELDRTLEDQAYGQRAAEIVGWAEDLFHDELANECYRALLVFADHAVGSGGRSETQAQTAAVCLVELAQGPRLDDLIGRACVRAAESGVRAAQLLLQLGRNAAPAIFERICFAGDLDQAAPLPALILALGEESLPTLVAAIDGPHDRRARIGIRLVGELQSPLALPVIVNSLSARDVGRKLEAIRALSLLTSKESKAALETALDSDLDEIVVAATSALAKNSGLESIPALLDVLEISLHSSRTPVCIELVKVLGRIGDERVVPRLASILERRPILRRAHWHAIQLAAVEALAILPTKEARRSVERSATHPARPVRARAQALIERFTDTP
ncbi:MAG: hypothetical protein V3T64_09915 [Myxococcota bacterium]